MQLRKDEYDQTQAKAKKKHQDETDNFTSKTSPNKMMMALAFIEKGATATQNNKQNLFRRKNVYNEDDAEYSTLPEENMIVATWINDMGSNHQEFEVSNHRNYLQTLTSIHIYIGQDTLLQQ